MAAHHRRAQPDVLRDRPYDLASYVSEAVATCHALRTCTNIGVGGSSGAVVAAAARFLRMRPESGPAICVCPDGSDRYENTVYDLQWVHAKGINVEDGLLLPFDDIDCY